MRGSRSGPIVRRRYAVAKVKKAAPGPTAPRSARKAATESPIERGAREPTLGHEGGTTAWREGADVAGIDRALTLAGATVDVRPAT